AAPLLAPALHSHSGRDGRPAGHRGPRRPGRRAGLRRAMISVVEVRDGTDLLAARELLAAYFASLVDHLAAHQLDLPVPRAREVAALPGEYAPPGGRLLLARTGGTAAGCVALRRLDAAACELRRLYVIPACRGTGLGRQLALAALAAAREMGYGRVRLNSLP